MQYQVVLATIFRHVLLYLGGALGGASLAGAISTDTIVGYCVSAASAIGAAVVSWCATWVKAKLIDKQVAKGIVLQAAATAAPVSVTVQDVKSGLDAATAAATASFVGTAKVALLGAVIGASLVLSACATNPATGTGGVSSAVNTYADAVTDFCTGVIACANDPVVVASSTIVPIVNEVRLSALAACTTADGLAALTKSATAIPWLASVKTVMQSGGAVLPAAVPALSLPPG